MATSSNRGIAARLTPQIIGRAIDNAPVSGALKYIAVVCCFGFLFDSMDNTLLSYALPSITKEFALTPVVTGMIASAGLFGMAAGSFFWGWLADRWGRIFVFTTTVLVFSLFSGLVALSFSVGFVVGARFLSGTGLGGTVPVDSTLLAEYTPARVRGVVLGSPNFAWPVGTFVAAGLGLWIVPTFGWRMLFVAGIVPALLTYFIRRGVPESPRWLAGRGRVAEAYKSLAYLGVGDAALERAEQDEAKEPTPSVQGKSRISDLFAPEMRLRVAHTWIGWICMQFTSWGFTMWLPSIYATVYHIDLVRTLQYTFMIAGWSAVSRFVALFLLDRFGRKPMLVVCFTGVALASICFTQSTVETLLVINALGFVTFNDPLCVTITVYATEVYPLRMRATGTAWAMGVGRIAGAISPIVIGYALVLTNITVVWAIFACVALTGAVVTLAIGRETRGENLERLTETPGGQAPPTVAPQAG